MNGVRLSATPPRRQRAEPAEVFLASPWVPAEWIKAHGLQPRGIWGCEAFDLGVASRAGSCALAAGILNLAQSRQDAACIFTTHCDQLRRSFDAARASPNERTFLFNLPATWGTAVARTIYRAELDRLSQFLIAVGGTAPEVGELASVMANYREKRALLCRASGHRRAKAVAEAILNFHWDGLVAPAAAFDRTPAGIPLALVGGPLPASRLGLFDIVEELGGQIVLNATEAGERSVWDAGPSIEGAGNTTALLDIIAQEYLDHCVDVFQRPNTRLYDWLGTKLVTRKPRAIILWHFTGCDLWSAEAQSLRETFGLPLLVLEADDAAGLTLRDRSRLEAIIESLS
jgi:hypothetical protein